MLVTRETIYQCDICGKQSQWIIGEWIAHVYLVGEDEPEFHLCSIACDEKLSQMTKSERKKLIKT